jgi:hypothetical protein
MSDTSQGPGWWVASDGKWYPPEQRPGGSDAADPPPIDSDPGTDDPAGTPWWKRPVPLWLVIVIAVLALGLGGAVAATDDGGSTAGADPTATSMTTSTTGTRDAETATTSTTVRPTTTSRPTTTTTTAPTTTTTTAPPRPGFGGGTVVVGTDVQPGVYVASGVDFCYWERLSGLGGGFDDIIANDNVTGQAVVEIAASDVAFNSQRCGRWELYEPPAAPVDSFGEGDWIVGEQIQPGRYRAEVRSWCYWERASGFGHGFGDIIANDNVQDGSAIVEIAPSDRRFSSSGCGTWRRA